MASRNLRFVQATLGCVALGCAALGLAGCFATRADPPPPILATVAAEEAGKGSVPAEPQAGLDAYAIDLQRIQVDIPRGTVIGEIRKVSPLIHCVGGWGTMTYDRSRNDVRPTEWKDTFHRVMSGHGYRVASSPDNLFEERHDNDVDYILGANIVEMSIDGMVLCDFISALSQGLTGTSRIVVEWQVFDPVKRRVVLREKIEGRFTSDRVMPLDNMLMVKMAFADSVNQLAAKTTMRNLVGAKPDEPGSAGRMADAGPRLPLQRQAASNQPLDMQIERIKAATVLIEVGASGHGSGFIVSPDGLIVTNAHVAGRQRKVRITMASGKTGTAAVLRQDEARDVALLRMDGGGEYPALTIRESPARVAEEVYAIGAPMTKRLGWTVTRGVVSAWRPARPPAQPYDLIQADVAIHGGNSGGPLLDRQGNVVAIAVLGWAMDQTQRNTSLNGFIPILDGLDKLGLDLTGPAVADPPRRVSAGQ